MKIKNILVILALVISLPVNMQSTDIVPAQEIQQFNFEAQDKDIVLLFSEDNKTFPTTLYALAEHFDYFNTQTFADLATNSSKISICSYSTFIKLLRYCSLEGNPALIKKFTLEQLVDLIIAADYLGIKSAYLDRLVTVFVDRAILKSSAHNSLSDIFEQFTTAHLDHPLIQSLKRNLLESLLQHSNAPKIKNPTNFAIFDPTERYLVTVTPMGILTITDRLSGKVIKTITECAINTAPQFDPTGHYLFVPKNDFFEIYQLIYSTGSLIPKISKIQVSINLGLNSNNTKMHDFVINPLKPYVISFELQSPKLFNLTTKESTNLHTLAPENESTLEQLLFDPTGTYLAARYVNPQILGKCIITQFNDNNLTIIGTLSNTRAIKSFDFDPTGNYFVAGGEDGVIYIFDTKTHVETSIDTYSPIQTVRISPDGATILTTAGTDGIPLSQFGLADIFRTTNMPLEQARLWDRGTRAHITDFNTRPFSPLKSAQFNTNGNYVILTSNNTDRDETKQTKNYAWVINKETKDIAYYIESAQIITHTKVDLVPFNNTEYVIARSDDGTAYFLDLTTNKHQAQRHTTPVISAQVSPRGTFLISTSKNNPPIITRADPSQKHGTITTNLDNPDTAEIEEIIAVLQQTLNPQKSLFSK